MNAKLVTIVAETLKLDEALVTPEIGADTCETWDSLAQVVIISRITDEMGVNVPFEKMVEISSVADLIELVGE